MKAIRRAGIDNFSPQFLKHVTPTAVFCCNKPLILIISLAESIGVAWDICFYAKKNTPPNYGGHLMTDVEYLMVLWKQSPKRGQEKELYSKAFFSVSAIKMAALLGQSRLNRYRNLFAYSVIAAKLLSIIIPAWHNLDRLRAARLQMLRNGDKPRICGGSDSTVG